MIFLTIDHVLDGTTLIGLNLAKKMGPSIFWFGASKIEEEQQKMGTTKKLYIYKKLRTEEMAQGLRTLTAIPEGWV